MVDSFYIEAVNHYCSKCGGFSVTRKEKMALASELELNKIDSFISIWSIVCSTFGLNRFYQEELIADRIGLWHYKT